MERPITPQRRLKDAGLDWWEIGFMLMLVVIAFCMLACIVGAYWLFRVAK